MIKIYRIYKTLLVICLFIIVPKCFGEDFLPRTSYEVCFTPGSNCAQKIIKTIAQAKQQILVQAYSFTDISIAEALVKAKNNDVDIRIILDKSKIKKEYNIINFLNKNKVIVIIADYSPAIAHNKVMVIDNTTTITGSYNYTNGARRNEENVIIVRDTGLARKYAKNWHICEQRQQMHRNKLY